MRFWLDIGVDGLRLDAIPYLCEREGTINENLPETHTVLKEMRRLLDQYYEARMFLAEANQWPADVRPYFGDEDECHMAFHFPSCLVSSWHCARPTAILLRRFSVRRPRFRTPASGRSFYATMMN